MNHRTLLLGLVIFGLAVAAGAQDALALYRDRKYEEAIAVTLRELETNKANMDAYSVLGWSLNNLKRYSEAVDHGRRAWNLVKTDHRIVGILAEAYYGLKQDANALEFYQRFVSMGSRLVGWDPRYMRDSYRDMAEIHIRFKEYHKADIALTTAIAYDRGRSALDAPRASRLQSRLGYARELEGDKAGAKAAYQAALAKDSTNTEASSGLTRVQ